MSRNARFLEGRQYQYYDDIDSLLLDVELIRCPRDLDIIRKNLAKTDVGRDLLRLSSILQRKEN